MLKTAPLLLFFLSVSASAQSVTVTVPGAGGTRAALSALSGEQSSLLDSLTASTYGEFRYTFGAGSPPGVHRLTFAPGKWVDFLLDGEEVEMRSHLRTPAESTEVVRSESNRRYYAFRRLNQQFKTKTEILQLVLARYPQDDPYYESSREAAAGLQRRYEEGVASAAGERPRSFMARYVRSARLPLVDLTLPPEEQLRFLKAHALDSVDFTDEGLVRSDLFTAKSIEYLMYYRNPQLPKELLAREFNRAVDSILHRARVNLVVYRHITEYLINGFRQFGFEECISYILENYVIKDDLCLQGTGNIVLRMIDQRKLLPVGAPAPAILLPDTAGRPTGLADVPGEKRLVVFYSTECPHCRTALPEIAALQREKGNAFRVLAVSLDANTTAWLEFLRSHAFTWTNVIDAQGWEGSAVRDYHIYATPTMFLLDRQGRILGKPMTVAELGAAL
jgi:peroxiredoxin